MRRHEVIVIMSFSLFFLYINSATLAQYPPFQNLPASLVSPSKEKAQIQVEGTVNKISFFHGRNDDEADWHVFIKLHPATRDELRKYIKSQNPDLSNIQDKVAKVKANELSELYSEVMVLDDYQNSLFDEKFLTADVAKAFLLSLKGSNQPAWDLGMRSVNDQGDNKNFIDHSRLKGKYVYLQGAFVNDKEHGFLPEIHPLDAIAFAMNDRGEPMDFRHSTSNWPERIIRWRVCFFANSNFHRINGESYLQKDRITTFYLELPKSAYTVNRVVSNSTTRVIPVNITIKREPVKLWDAVRKNEYSGRGWKTYPTHEIAVDPRDGRKKLKVTCVMKKPDKFGGIVVCDYVVKIVENVAAQRAP